MRVVIVADQTLFAEAVQVAMGDAGFDAVTVVSTDELEAASVGFDIVYVYGYGFPAYRGGPTWYADTVGLKKVHDRIREFEKQHGARWAPAPLLTKLAEGGKTFASLDAARA